MPNSRILLPLAILLIAILGFTMWFQNFNQKPKIGTTMDPKTEAEIKDEIKFVAIGDSYTIGLGVAETDRWPNVLVDHLRKEGLNVTLVANPSVSGYRVSAALEQELPEVKRKKPDFVTVLIGANDNFGEKSAQVYGQELKGFLDKLQSILGNPKNIVLITIPDYSKSPAAVGYQTESISKSIEEYNQIIKNEAEKRGLKVVDIFPISQTMTAEDYISDGLHPAAKGYAKWEKIIFPEVLELVKDI